MSDIKVTVQRCDVSHLLGQPRPMPTGTPGPGVIRQRADANPSLFIVATWALTIGGFIGFAIGLGVRP